MLSKSQKELEEKILEKVKGRLLFCFRCENVWILKNIKHLPKNCPKCNSNYWNKPRQKELEEFLFSKEGIKRIGKDIVKHKV